MGKWHNEFLSCDKDVFSMRKFNWKVDTDSGEKVAHSNSAFTRFVGWINAMLNPNHAWFDYDKLDSTLSSVQNQITQEGVTGQQQALNDMQMQNVEDQYQRQVVGMQKAGLNPALMYQSGASSSAPSAPATQGQGFNMSDLMQVLLIPEQKALMRAQAANLESSAKKNEKQVEKIAEEIGLVRSRIENSDLDAEQKKIALRYQDEFARADLAIKNASADNLRASYDSTMESIRKMKFEELSHVFGYLETIEKISVMEKSKELSDAQIKELGALTDKLNAERRYINLQSDNFDLINGFVTNASIGVGPFKGSQSGVITLADLKRGVRAAMDEREEPKKGKGSDSQESWQDTKRKASDAYGALE